jgi:hypothetical protein
MKKSIDCLSETEKDDFAEKEPDQQNVRYLCMKYNRYQQGKTLQCQDPDLYCKYRSSCLIHYEDKRRRRNQDATDA